jgi:hypothetical protein
MCDSGDMNKLNRNSAVSARKVVPLAEDMNSPNRNSTVSARKVVPSTVAEGEEDNNPMRPVLASAGETDQLLHLEIARLKSRVQELETNEGRQQQQPTATATTADWESAPPQVRESTTIPIAPAAATAVKMKKHVQEIHRPASPAPSASPTNIPTPKSWLTESRLGLVRSSTSSFHAMYEYEDHHHAAAHGSSGGRSPDGNTTTMTTAGVSSPGPMRGYADDRLDASLSPESHETERRERGMQENMSKMRRLALAGVATARLLGSPEPGPGGEHVGHGDGSSTLASTGSLGGADEEESRSREGHVRHIGERGLQLLQSPKPNK